MYALCTIASAILAYLHNSRARSIQHLHFNSVIQQNTDMPENAETRSAYNHVTTTHHEQR